MGWTGDTIDPRNEYSDVHVVLLGDSTLDNGRYLQAHRGQMSVDQQVARRCAERGWELTMLAQDGSMLEDVEFRQLPLIPESATHIIISASGNDLLSLLNQMVVNNFAMRSVYSAIVEGLSQVAENYRTMLASLKHAGRHVACCTVYQPNFNHFFFRSLATFGLGLHNSRIRSTSVDLDISLIDIAQVFGAPEDFANPLELSTRGGAKFVENIVSFVDDHPANISDQARRHGGASIVYADDDQLMPAGMYGGGLATPMRCCATKAPNRRVYSSKYYPPTLEEELAAECENPLVGAALGPALDFSEAQGQWRESVT